jgi:hypothetical protein
LFSGNRKVRHEWVRSSFLSCKWVSEWLRY